MQATHEDKKTGRQVWADEVKFNAGCDRGMRYVREIRDGEFYGPGKSQWADTFAKKYRPL